MTMTCLAEFSNKDSEEQDMDDETNFVPELYTRVL